MTELAPLSSSPLVSVVIPTLNRPAFLREAVAGVLRQTYRNWEIIVVDDGSELPAEEALKEIAAAPRIRFIRRDRSAGVSAARNAGVDSAHGELMAFLDDDDLWLPAYIETSVKTFLADPLLGMVRSQVRVLDLATGKSQPAYHLVPGPNSLDLLFEYGCATPSGVMVRKECLAAIGGFDERLSRTEDVDVCLRLAERFPCFTTREELAIQRVHAGNTLADEYRFRAAFVSFYERMLKRPPRGIARSRVRSKIVFWHQILLCHLIEKGGSPEAPRHAAAALTYWLANPSVWREAPKLPRLCARATLLALARK